MYENVFLLSNFALISYFLKVFGPSECYNKNKISTFKIVWILFYGLNYEKISVCIEYVVLTTNSQHGQYLNVSYCLVQYLYLSKTVFLRWCLLFLFFTKKMKFKFLFYSCWLTGFTARIPSTGYRIATDFSFGTSFCQSYGSLY